MSLARAVMGQLTIEQRVKRGMNRTNKKMSEKYPLFADQFSVTFDQQKVILENQLTKNEEHFARMKVVTIAAWDRGMKMRERARLVMTVEEFADCDRRYDRIYGGRGEYAKPEHAGFNLADWWRTLLKNHGVEVTE